MKKHHLIIAVIIVVAIAYYYFRSKKISNLRQQALAWANSDENPTTKPIRVAGVKALPDSQLSTLVNLINNYFNVNAVPPPDLQNWWTMAASTYHIDGKA